MNDIRLKEALVVLLLLGLFTVGCGDGKAGSGRISRLANKINRKTLRDDYPKVPDEELIRNAKGGGLYRELQKRYSKYLVELHKEVQNAGAKMVVVVMTPEIGKFATQANTQGIPYIVQECNNLGIDCVDITPDISEWTSVNDPERSPQGGNWSKKGAAFAADMMAGVVAIYDGYKNKKTYPAESRPETFGDATPGVEAEDDYSGNNFADVKAYRFTINDQGLRMNGRVTFPKVRQRILFLGDSRIFNRFLDDKYTITELLQKRYPDKEMLNAGYLSYTMDDYLSLYKEKAKYAEADIVVVCTNGGDILNEYFSHRNKYSRTLKAYKPSELEKDFYVKNFR